MLSSAPAPLDNYDEIQKWRELKIRMNWGICDGTAKVNKPWLEEAKILLTISKQSLNSMRILPGQWAAP